MAAHSSAGARGEQLERTLTLCLIPHLSHVAHCRAQFIFRPVGGLTAELRLTSQVLARLRLALARECFPQSNLVFLILDGLRAKSHH